MVDDAAMAPVSRAVGHPRTFLLLQSPAAQQGSAWRRPKRPALKALDYFRLRQRSSINGGQRQIAIEKMLRASPLPHRSKSQRMLAGYEFARERPRPNLLSVHVKALGRPI